VLLSVVAVAGLLSMVLDPVPARAGTATIPWGNVACDPPSAQLPDPAKRRGVLFLNVGGPGGQGLNAPRLFYLLLQGTLGDAGRRRMMPPIILVIRRTR
jgi:hypothetical protein